MATSAVCDTPKAIAQTIIEGGADQGPAPKATWPATHAEGETVLAEPPPGA